MATDYVANLERAREQLMAQRRSLAEALAGGYQRGETERQMELFRSIQGTLADIEEAITDERRRAPQRGSKEFSPRKALIVGARCSAPARPTNTAGPWRGR